MSFGISNLAFITALAVAIYFFSKSIQRISRNIKLGKSIDRTDQPSARWREMIRVALGQSKMVARPVAGVMHILIYLGFVIINIEVLEIVLDGIFGTHRLFAPVLGSFYFFLINSFEVLAVAVLLACVVFLARRNVVKIGRFFKPEMKGWPTSDANYILIIEILLMGAFLTMNAADLKLMNMPLAELQQFGLEKYAVADSGMWFWISGIFANALPSNPQTLALIERGMWWFHILGILAFLNYLPISKHFHILLAFPNVWYSNLKAKGEFNNLESVTREVKLMLDPNADPYAAPAADGGTPEKFGAKDVTDLSWKQLMDAYTCTECGRCTSECPANQTGKKLSPRKIMMDTRDRLTEVGKGIDIKGALEADGKSLLFDYITPEEIWACTTCNACVQACPVNIDPLSIIVDLRRYLVMEESAAPAELNNMMTNIENNGAPWQFSQADRLNWKDE